MYNIIIWPGNIFLTPAGIICAWQHFSNITIFSTLRNITIKIWSKTYLSSHESSGGMHNGHGSATVNTNKAHVEVTSKPSLKTIALTGIYKNLDSVSDPLKAVYLDIEDAVVI